MNDSVRTPAMDPELPERERRQKKNETYRQTVNNRRLAATNGELVAQHLLNTFLRINASEVGEKDPKWQMFSEIVTRCACDVAGNMHSINPDKHKYNGLDDLFEQSARNKNESFYRKLLNLIPLYKKGIVQTPHPTETLPRDAISAEIALHHAIEETSQLFTGSALHLDLKRDGNILQQMWRLYETMKPEDKSMVIPHEINRSIEMSELTFNAVPHMMQAILDPAIRSGARNTQPLTHDELRHFGRLLEAYTWSPGDRDSKPDMTEEMLRYGIEQNRHLMAMQYAVKIAELLSALEESSPSKDQRQACDQLHIILARILNGIPEKLRPNGEGDTVGGKFLQHYITHENGTQAEKKPEIARTVTIYAHTNAKPFASTEEMVQALETVHGIKKVRFPSYNGSKVLSQLDVLAAQMHCFGSCALRSQIRENATMHEQVMQQVRDLPEVAALIPKGTDRKQTAESLLDALAGEQGDRLRQAVAQYLENQKPTAGQRGSDLYETLAGMKLAAENPEAIPHYLIAECRNATDILEAFAQLKLVEPVPPPAGKRVEIVPLVEHREAVLDSAKMLKEAYDNPHFATHHATIGQDSRSLWREDSKLLAKDKTGHVLSYSELEARKEQIKEALEQALKEDGLLSEEELTARRKQIREKYALSPEPHYDRLTVADVKRAYNIALKEGDEEREIRHTKMMMFAGSDIMKSAGPAGAALTQQAIEHLREEMLNWKTPVLLVDYTGSGGGIHRSQPVSTAFETTQGRSMRQTAGSIAHKSILTMSRFVRRMLELPGAVERRSEQERRRLAQLNLGNLAGFPTQPDTWDKDTGSRCGDCMVMYQKLYTAPEFACMLAFSADKFVKLTSYAARPMNRIEEKNGSGASTHPKEKYPPAVDVEKLRAIGYGAALNTSGSCASMYYGVSKFLHADEILSGKEDIQPLLDLYLHDPKAQDVINRATFGIAMADMDTAWRYLNVQRQHKDAQPPIDNHIVCANQATIETWAAGTREMKILQENCRQATEGKEREALHKAKMAWLASLDWFQKNNLAKHAMAQVDLEYQKVAKVLLKLHSRIAEKAPPDVEHMGALEIQQKLIEALPAALKTQIQSSRAHIHEARQKLAEQFRDSWDEEKPSHILRDDVTKLRGIPEIYDPIYYRMGACFECFENVPRAYTRPYWAVEIEKNAGKQNQISG